MSSYLAQWADPGLKLDTEETQEHIESQELERLAKLRVVATAAAAIPRRLGGDATVDELTRDKRRCRRISHVAIQSTVAWGGKAVLYNNNEGEVSRSTNKEAAQVDWKKWWAEHQVWLLNRVRYIASLAQEGIVPERWAKSAIVKLNNETGWLEYALRDD